MITRRVSHAVTPILLKHALSSITSAHDRRHERASVWCIDDMTWVWLSQRVKNVAGGEMTSGDELGAEGACTVCTVPGAVVADHRLRVSAGPPVRIPVVDSQLA